MSAEWKPGDVAMVTGRWIRTEDHSERYAVRRAGGWISRASISIADWEVSDARPLAVIDPEDAEQVERLTDGLYGGHHGGTVRVRAALREFARPTPSIDEPRGLGAVVEDADGKRFTRVCTKHVFQPEVSEWRCNGAADLERSNVQWSAINAVRILSDGVPS